VGEPDEPDSDEDGDEGPAGGARRYLTRAGAERMHAELLALLNVERPKVTSEVSAAAAQGDRSENAEYIYGKRRLREIDSRLEFLSRRLDELRVIAPEDLGDGVVQILFFPNGSTSGAEVQIASRRDRFENRLVVTLDPLLGRIQNDLFDVEADLCLPGKGKGPGGARLTVTDAQVAWLEQEIDRLNGELEPLKSFVLPGGSAAAAYLHLARTVCRRAERIMVELNDQPGETVTAAALKYINRLSDFLFVASRFVNDKGAADLLWVPGQNR